MVTKQGPGRGWGEKKEKQRIARTWTWGNSCAHVSRALAASIVVRRIEFCVVCSGSPSCRAMQGTRQTRRREGVMQGAFHIDAHA